MNHIIRRQLLELSLDNKDKPFDLQNRLNDHFYTTLLPLLEKWFDELAGEDEVLYIDKLVLDLGLFSTREFNEQLLKERLTRQLELSRIQSTKPSPNTHRRSTAYTAFEQWLSYMEKGYLPWNMLRITREWEDKVLATLATDYPAITRLRTILTTKPLTLTRIVLQQDESFLINLTEILTTIQQTTLPKALQDLQSLLQYGAQLESSTANQPITPTNNPKAITAPKRPTTPTPETIWQDTLLLAATLGNEATIQKLIYRLIDTYWEDLPSFQPAIDTYLSTRPATKTLLIDYPKYRTETVPTKKTPIQNKQQPSLPNPAKQHTPTRYTSADPLPPTAATPPAKTESITQSITQSTPQSTPPEKPSPIKASTPVDEIIKDFSPDELPDEGLFIANTGVILTHPFLSHLFKLTGLTVNGKFIADAARQKAIHLVHYLATGHTFAAEHELAIAKIICGCPLEIPMEKHAAITEEEKKEADDLLEGLISHWGVKGITIEGLRGNFLTRNGKLSPKKDKLQLVIEKHAVDILVRTYPFPWNMSIIKLPWCKQAIHLDW